MLLCYLKRFIVKSLFNNVKKIYTNYLFDYLLWQTNQNVIVNTTKLAKTSKGLPSIHPRTLVVQFKKNLFY